MKNAIRLVEIFGSAVAGLVATGALDTAYGWWLNSGTEVLRTSLALSALGLFATVWRGGHPWERASGLWAGAIVEMTTLLFTRGPGTIWPIVLVFAASISAAAIYAGARLGASLNRLSR